MSSVMDAISHRPTNRFGINFETFRNERSSAPSIRERAAEIRKGWSEQERQHRLQLAAKRRLELVQILLSADIGSLEEAS